MIYSAARRWQLGILWKDWSAPPGVGRTSFRSSPFDSLWWRLVLLTPVSDDATAQEHVDDVPVIFIQHANDLGDREFVVDEQVANRHLSLGFRVQTSGVARKQELLSTNWETVVENGVSHRSASPLQGNTLNYRHCGWERLQRMALLKCSKRHHHAGQIQKRVPSHLIYAFTNLSDSRD